MIVMKLVKALADGMIAVEGEAVHQILQQRPDGGAGEHQGKAVHARQSKERRNGKRDGDEVAKMPDALHQSGGQARNITQHCTFPALTSAAFLDPKTRGWNNSHDEGLTKRVVYRRSDFSAAIACTSRCNTR